MKKALVFLIGIILSGVVGAMFTTDYAEMISHGESHWAALKVGLVAVLGFVETLITSPWFYLPLAGIALILITRYLTLRAPLSKESNSPDYVSLGFQMQNFVYDINKEKQFRGFSLNDTDPITLSYEITSFMVTLHEAGLPVPSMQSNVAEPWIDLSLKYFTAVGPFLRNGQPDYAKNSAKKFANDYPPRQS